MVSQLAFAWIVAVVSAWDLFWKLIGSWKAAKNDKLGWFVCILIFNTIGILPLIYIHFFDKQTKKLKKKSKKK